MLALIFALLCAIINLEFYATATFALALYIAWRFFFTAVLEQLTFCVDRTVEKRAQYHPADSS
ncbi:MAG: hypothetical protein WAL97_00080 [Halobacteriota archaeon]